MPSRPDDHSEPARLPETGKPEGGGHDVRRFSTRQDAASKNPECGSGGRFALEWDVFFGDFLCAKESRPRVSAERDSGFSKKKSRSLAPPGMTG